MAKQEQDMDSIVKNAYLKLGYEVLEGGNAAGKAFRTPLATLHKFQGWADKFIGPSTSGTPAGWRFV